MNDTGSTSPLVSLPALLIWTVGLFASLCLGSMIASVLFLSLLLLTVITRLWARIAMKNVSLNIRCSRLRLFPGENTILTYEITNNKLLPLPWLETVQNRPDRDCLSSDDQYQPYHIPGTPPAAATGLRLVFGHVGAFRTVSEDHIWKAERRGIYLLRGMGARSGDGFGLVQREVLLPFGQIPAIAVYPRLVDVDTAPFVRAQWDCRASRNGWLEDQTILKGTREYQAGDSWKQINWRMAAREQGLPVNLWQTVSPYSVRFILDGESFCRAPEELEKALSVLASLLIALSGRHMEVSVSLSRSAGLPPMTLTGSADDDCSELLFHLAGFQCLAEETPDSRADGSDPIFFPSFFAEDAVSAAGSLWLITLSGAILPEQLLNHMKPASSRILCFRDMEAAARVGIPALSVHSLLRSV